MSSLTGGYEAHYVNGHRSGDERARVDRDYAIKHGASRGPAQPDMGIDMSL